MLGNLRRFLRPDPVEQLQGHLLRLRSELANTREELDLLSRRLDEGAAEYESLLDRIAAAPESETSQLKLRAVRRKKDNERLIKRYQRAQETEEELANHEAVLLEAIRESRMPSANDRRALIRRGQELIAAVTVRRADAEAMGDITEDLASGVRDDIFEIESDLRQRRERPRQAPGAGRTVEE